MSEDTLGEDDLRRLLEGFIFKPEALEETALKYKGLPKSDSASLLVNAVIDLA